MKPLTSFIILYFACYNFSISQELIPDSDKKLIDSKELEGKSKDFLRYARNEIYARKGYVFNAQDLNTFFRQQPWYVPKSKDVKLSAIEKKNIELLLAASIEWKYADLEIIFKRKIDNLPVFYLANEKDLLNLDENNNPFKHWGGLLINLSNNFSWTIESKSIPPEYLLRNSISKYKVSDDDIPLKKDGIKIIKMAEKCGNNSTQITFHLEGPSDDPGIIIFDLKDKKLRELVNIEELFQGYKCKSKNIVELEFLNRGYHEFYGNTYFKELYNLNLDTKTLTKTFSDENNEIEKSFERTTIKDMDIYVDNDKTGNTEIVKIPVGSNVKIEIGDNKRILTIKYKNHTGRIARDDFSEYFWVDNAD